MARRRKFLKVAGAASIVGLAGCSGGGNTSGDGSGGDNMSGDGDGSGGDSMSGDGDGDAAMTFGGDGTVNFGISPSVPQEDLEVQYAPLLDHVGSYLQQNHNVPEGLNVEGNIGSNYSAVIQSLGQGTTDLAETGPFAAALGVKTGNAEIILQRYGYGGWTYKSIIATPNDSDITELSDLSGKTVAFSDRLSTSGALYPLYSMSNQGGLDVGNLPEGNGSQAEFDARFAGGHVGSYTLLEQGQVDAAAMGGFVRDTSTGPTPEEWQQVATTLHEDEGLPRAPIVVSPELSDDVKSALQASFLEAPDSIYYGADGEGGTGDDLWFSRVREAAQEDYQSVIDVADELGVGADIFGQ
ncbi:MULTISPECIES: phosphate/phosphite/phosphonate ABC transporter substrate-binding protein [Halorubrum]|uniref:Phosphonate transport system substrate-binding protein n=1 Tax=Halorubrum sodomense TaxID=35743 RepID=A0A1I6FVV7_HALSD|nr:MULTISPECIES: phosphate/phosphite/phosphonate ABC transporter substrate-binding protein [Halorubrum]TKX53485.1 phosphate/phosphite/phosphonate ABC transporter substrate-binding protein [Halorubrum sp. SP3]TKX69589.1 phosphate/phosphite/phosphonate ABC transporter substrate-binding protein [Halorubrum sp. SP9]SFR34016.1 phosphonate transport system substrate-binding protein [Halorubrum sodomense]